jgi:hypothetical protein
MKELYMYLYNLIIDLLTAHATIYQYKLKLLNIINLFKFCGYRSTWLIRFKIIIIKEAYNLFKLSSLQITYVSADDII